MNSKEKIIKAATDLISENPNCPEEITIREISKRANVGVGLINYHFETKEKLIEICVQNIINGIVAKFSEISALTKNDPPFERLDRLGNMTLSYLFDHRAVSKISGLSDMNSPSINDNTQRTLEAYIPLVTACRPDWDEKKIRLKTFELISCMQLSFLRHDVLRQTDGIDLTDPCERRKYHTQMLKSILEIDE